MKFVKVFCGDDSEIILEEVLKHRHVTASQVIVKTCKRLEMFPRELILNIMFPFVQSSQYFYSKNFYIIIIYHS